MLCLSQQSYQRKEPRVGVWNIEPADPGASGRCGSYARAKWKRWLFLQVDDARMLGQDLDSAVHLPQVVEILLCDVGVVWVRRILTLMHQGQ